MIELVLKTTAQIKDMENQIETLIKEEETLKETNISPIPTVIPMVSIVVPSTLAEKLAPKRVLETACQYNL